MGSCPSSKDDNESEEWTVSLLIVDLVNLFFQMYPVWCNGYQIETIISEFESH